MTKYRTNKGEKEDTGVLLNSRCVTVCVNSLMVNARLSRKELGKYVVYIDDIYSFLHYLTHSNRLDTILKRVYEPLKNMFKKWCQGALHQG